LSWYKNPIHVAGIYSDADAEMKKGLDITPFTTLKANTKPGHADVC
jgi:hypothetical protein